MRTVHFVGAIAAALMMSWAGDARADIIFSINQGSLQPDENVLFDCPSCISGPGPVVRGATNKTGALIDFTGVEDLVSPSSGQARVESADGDGFNYIEIDAFDPNNFFSEFEANVRLFAKTSGTATVTACNQLGDPCEVFNITLKQGANWFVLGVISPQLIDTISISSDIAVMDLRQIRVSVCDPETENCDNVPEPTSLALMGVALLVGGRRFRRKTNV